MLRLGAPAVLAAVVLEAHGHVFSLIPVRAAVLAAALRDRALLGELPPIVSVRAEQNGVRKRPWPGASCGGCLNEGTRGPMGRKRGHGVVFMTHHRRQPPGRTKDAGPPWGTGFYSQDKLFDSAMREPAFGTGQTSPQASRPDYTLDDRLVASGELCCTTHRAVWR